MVEFPIGLFNGKFSPRKRSLKKKEKNFFLVSISQKKKKVIFGVLMGSKLEIFAYPEAVNVFSLLRWIFARRVLDLWYL